MKSNEQNGRPTGRRQHPWFDPRSLHPLQKRMCLAAPCCQPVARRCRTSRPDRSLNLAKVQAQSKPSMQIQLKYFSIPLHPKSNVTRFELSRPKPNETSTLLSNKFGHPFLNLYAGKKLLGTSASLVVTSALLVVTRTLVVNRYHHFSISPCLANRPLVSTRFSFHQVGFDLGSRGSALGEPIAGLTHRVIAAKRRRGRSTSKRSTRAPT